MIYTDLSMKELKNISVCAAQRILEKEPIDLVIYIARAGFPIAFYMNTVFQSRLLGITAIRKGNRVKSIIGKILLYLPKFIKDFLRIIELKLQVHKRHLERHVEFHSSLGDLDRSAYYSILIVDDSVDTGNSMYQVKKKVSETFPNAKIVTYAVNVFDESKTRIIVDFSTFQNTVMRTPMSKDSREYKLFCKMYQRETMCEYL